MSEQYLQAGTDPAILTEARGDHDPDGAKPLGRLARRLYGAQLRSKYRAVHSKLHKNLRMRFPLLNNFSRAWTFARRHAGKVRRQRNVPVLHQVLDLLKLVFFYRTDPAAYYALNLYEPPHSLAEVEHYIGRKETKNGLYGLMQEALCRGRSRREHSLTNKALFAENCVNAGLPHIRILASAENGTFTIQDSTPGAFDRDLFIKLTRGSGTFGARFYRRRDDGRYAAKDGSTFDRDALFKELSESSKWRPLIVNRWLSNHAEIADLATDSLLTFRIFTCLEPRVSRM